MAERQGSRRQKRQAEYFFDYSLLFIVLFLLGFGLVMIYSASSYAAYQDYDGDAAHYLKRQLIAVIIGLVMMIGVSQFDYHLWSRFYIIGYLGAAGAILLVKTPLGIESHGATRWFKIPVIGFQVQPAELAKIAVILFMAVVICKVKVSRIRKFTGFVKMMMIPVPLALMIYIITNNLSSAIIVMAIAAVMVFVADPGYGKYLIMLAAGIALVAIVVMVAVNATESGNFRLERITAWLDPESDSTDTGFQTLQGLYAIGSGGIWGKGLGESMQKLSYLPEAQNDMIFSIICEELGLFGAVAIILMFVMLIWRMMVIAYNASDLFGSMLVVGVMGHIAVQAILNIAVVTNTVPNTGISLPFISYGGSSVMCLLVEIGLVLSVAKRIQLKDA